MELELEGGHHPEIAATAPQRPEQILVLTVTGMEQLAISGHDIGGEEVVDGEPEFPARPTKAAAQCQPRDSRRRVDAQWRGKPERLCFLIEVSEGSARLDACRPGNRVDAHGFH